MPKIISLHDVLEPLKQALLASRDVIISSQICGSKLQKVFTLGDGCWLPSFSVKKGGGNSVNGGFGKDFYRKGNSVKRSGRFSEPPDSEKWKVAFLIPFPKISSYGPVLSQNYCRTSGRRTAVQDGRRTAVQMGSVMLGSLSSRLRNQEATTTPMVGALPYKLEVHRSTFSKTSGGWGFWNSSDMCPRAHMHAMRPTQHLATSRQQG